MKSMINEMIMESPPFPECHASTVVELGNGDFLAAWFAGMKEGADNVAVWGAIRAGGFWKPPTVIAKVNDLPHWNPVLFKDRSDTIHLFFRIGKDPMHWQTWTIQSADEGRTWSAPAELIPGETEGRGPVKNKCIVLSDGSWLAPASIETDQWMSFADRSEDGGRTWQKSDFVPVDKKMFDGCTSPGWAPQNHGVIQPTLWESAPGRVHMLMRSSCGRICRSDSADFGKTWCEAYKTELPNNNSGIDLTRLADGALVLAFNPEGVNWGYRWPMRLSISLDNGSTWRTMFDTDTESNREYSYPAIIATADGGIALTYTYGRKNIKFVLMNRRDIDMGKNTGGLYGKT